MTGSTLGPLGARLVLEFYAQAWENNLFKAIHFPWSLPFKLPFTIYFKALTSCIKNKPEYTNCIKEHLEHQGQKYF